MTEINIAEDLTVEEIDTLIAGLDAWVRRDDATDVLREFMTMGIAGQDKVRLQEMQKQLEIDRSKKQLQRTDEADTAVMLKAKLVVMKRRILRSR